MSSSGAKNQKRGGKQRGQERDNPEVRLSKTLTWILRHGAKGEGLKMRPDGYVKVTDLVSHFCSLFLGLLYLELSLS
jgi:2'-phosphotransferase